MSYTRRMYVKKINKMYKKYIDNKNGYGYSIIGDRKIGFYIVILKITSSYVKNTIYTLCRNVKFSTDAKIINIIYIKHDMQNIYHIYTRGNIFDINKYKHTSYFNYVDFIEYYNDLITDYFINVRISY